MTSQGTAHGRFTRAIQTRNLWAARPGSIFELGNPVRDAVVRDVRLRVDGLITVYVDVTDGTVPPVEPRS
jgi:hypothetical protein